MLVGPEVGLTRDSVRTQFQHEGRTIYLVIICILCLLLYFRSNASLSQIHSIPVFQGSNYLMSLPVLVDGISLIDASSRVYVPHSAFFVLKENGYLK